MLSYIFVCFVFRLKTVFQRCQKSKYSYIAVIVEIISFRLRSYRHFFKMQNISRSTFLTSRYFPSHWTLRCRSTPSSQRRLLYSRYYISPNKQHNKVEHKIVNIFLPNNLNICFGAQKNRLGETVL